MITEFTGVDKSPEELLEELPSDFRGQFVMITACRQTFFRSRVAGKNGQIGKIELLVPVHAPPEDHTGETGDLVEKEPGVHEMEPLGAGGVVVAFRDLS